ncbi:MAG: hypothetical protein J6S29_05410 [Methanosphaera sp.]|nr:hypothetical protein [Methanosphaera sp.]
MKQVLLDKSTYEKYANEISGKHGNLIAGAEIMDMQLVLTIGMIIASVLADMETKIFEEDK